MDAPNCRAQMRTGVGSKSVGGIQEIVQKRWESQKWSKVAAGFWGIVFLKGMAKCVDVGPFPPPPGTRAIRPKSLRGGFRSFENEFTIG